MKSNKKIIGVIVVVALVFAMVAKLFANYNEIENNKKQTTYFLNTVTVSVAPVKMQNTERTLSLVGTLSSNSEIVIAAQAQGKITQADFELGTQKVKGSIIGVIDNKLKKLAVETARITYKNLKKDLQRYEKLAKGGSVSQQQLDEALTSFKNAEIKMEEAKKQLADATIVSPVNGVIIEKNVEAGSFVNIGSPIATIVDVSRLKAKLSVSETNVYSLKIGDKATITTDVFPGVTFYGKVSFISAKGDDAHNYPVEVELTNNSYQLKSGTFVNVIFNLNAGRKELVIPREALLGSRQNAKVYVCKNNKAVLRSVDITKGSDKYLIVTGGLQEGEKVVVSGQVNLTDGHEIKIIENN